MIKIIIWLLALAFTVLLPGLALPLWALVWFTTRARREERKARLARQQAEADMLQGRVNALRQRFELVTGGLHNGVAETTDQG